jgi:membrane-anchored protein YejM (alkaline phosphatase superfamily)
MAGYRVKYHMMLRSDVLRWLKSYAVSTGMEGVRFLDNYLKYTLSTKFSGLAFLVSFFFLLSFFSFSLSLSRPNCNTLCTYGSAVFVSDRNRYINVKFRAWNSVWQLVCEPQSTNYCRGMPGIRLENNKLLLCVDGVVRPTWSLI